MLVLMQRVRGCDVTSQEFRVEAKELADVIGELNVLASRGELPELWRPGVPWLDAADLYKAKLATVPQDYAKHIERVMGTCRLVGRSQARELADLVGITITEAAHAIHAATLDDISESKG